MRKKIAAAFAALIVILSTASCDYIDKYLKPSHTSAVSETAEATDAETQPVYIAPYTDPITGEPSETDNGNSRPVAIVVKNDRAAAPQYGLSKAAVLYEAPVEGGLTRFLAVYSDVSYAEKIGPVIDSRGYFYDFAANHNAVFVQAGTTAEGNKVQVARGVTALDAIVGDMSPGFYRDNTLKTTRGAENSVVTDANGLRSRARSFGVGLTVDKQTLPFTIVDYLKNRDMTGGSYCTNLIIPFSANMTVEYSYSTLTNKYSRKQYGEAHTDAVTGKQLSFTNLIVLIADYTTVDIKTGEMKLSVGMRGNGYYVYGGSYIMINWQRGDGAAPVKLYETDGKTPLEISSGNTYIAVISPKLSGRIEFK